MMWRYLLSSLSSTGAEVVLGGGEASSLSQQYHPLPQEYLATGLFGIFAYLILLAVALQSTNHYHTSALTNTTGSNTTVISSKRSKTTRRFFAAITIMSLLELPRYFALAIDRAYTSRTTYAFHLLANIFFFLSYSIVCRQWSSLLQLASYFRVIYGNKGLFVANIVFAVVDILGIITLSTSFVSLDDFFFSTAFTIITFLEGMRNLIYSVFLLFYGMKLIRRFAHFSILEQQAYIRKHSIDQHGRHTRRENDDLDDFGDDSWSTWLWQQCSRAYKWTCRTCWESALTMQWLFCSPKQSNERIFTKVVFRLLVVLLLTTLCFLLRMIMLLLKIIAIHATDTMYTSPTFTLFGFAWFTCSDFIPRLLPAYAFVFLMRSKKPKKNQLSVSHVRGNSEFNLEAGIDLRQHTAASKPQHDSQDDESSISSRGSFSLISFLAEDPEESRRASKAGYSLTHNSDEGPDFEGDEYQFGKRKGLLSSDQFVIESYEDDEQIVAPPSPKKSSGKEEETIITLSELHRMTSNPSSAYDEEDDRVSDYSDDDDDEDDENEAFAEAAIDKIFSLISRKR